MAPGVCAVPWNALGFLKYSEIAAFSSDPRTRHAGTTLAAAWTGLMLLHRHVRHLDCHDASRHPPCVHALDLPVERESGRWVGTGGFVPARDVTAHSGYAAEPSAGVQALDAAVSREH